MEDIKLTKPQVTHFVKHCLLNGGSVNTTGFKGWNSLFPSYCNPSIYWDEQDAQFLMIQRTTSYTLHACKDYNWDSWGPLHYCIPQERFDWLETVNYIGQSNDPINEGFIFFPIQMKPRKQQWSFRGLEDARCVRWNGKLYAIGVRRDDNPTGVGRMELCELNDNYEEVSSVKLKAPDGDKVYCVKNWMPVTDCPYRFIDRAANPTRLVSVDPETGEISSIIERETKIPVLEGFDMPRGSSQCIPWDEGHHLCIVHSCQMYYTGNKRKYARYLHAFIEYDEDWDIVGVSPTFSFDDLMVEFCTGMTMKDDMVYISFALQDNISYVLSIEDYKLAEFIYEKTDWNLVENNQLTNTVWDTLPDQDAIYKYGMSLYDAGDKSGAYTWFTKAMDLYPHTYNERLMAARSVADLGHRDSCERALWIDCIEHDESRPEGYAALAMYYHCRGSYREARYWINQAMMKMVIKEPTLLYTRESIQNCYKLIHSQCSTYDSVNKKLVGYKVF